MSRTWLPFSAITLLAFALRFTFLIEALELPLFLVPISDAQAYWEPWARLPVGALG